MSDEYDPMGLRDPIIVVQRLGVVTFADDVSEREVEVFTRHLRHAHQELSRPTSGTLSGTPFEVDESLIGTEYGPSKRE